MNSYKKMDYVSGFEEYAMKHLGVSGMQFHYWGKLQETLYNDSKIVSSVTPMIIEEREMRAVQMSVFDRLMMDRIIWIAGPVHDGMSTVVQAQLMWLDVQDKNADITMHIDTPGGSVKSGLGMIDVMNYVRPDIVTINTGMAASMGSVLLGAGTKGKRYSLPHSRVMLHQVSGGAQGNIQDMEISIAEAKKMNKELFDLLGEYCDKPAKEVLDDSERDNWLTSKEAIKYGIIDKVITKKAK